MWCINSRRRTTLKPLYQYRYGNMADFLYTTNFNELGNGGGGWTRLAAEMLVYNAQATGTVPFYRFYSPQYRKHFYSTNRNEVCSPTWLYEGITGYIWPQQRSGTTPIRRWFKWNFDGPVHIYKFADQTEDALLLSTGWYYEGIIGYAPPCITNC